MLHKQGAQAGDLGLQGRDCELLASSGLIGIDSGQPMTPTLRPASNICPARRRADVDFEPAAATCWGEVAATLGSEAG
jgi:hypothetical protein